MASRFELNAHMFLKKIKGKRFSSDINTKLCPIILLHLEDSSFNLYFIKQEQLSKLGTSKGIPPVFRQVGEVVPRRAMAKTPLKRKMNVTEDSGGILSAFELYRLHIRHIDNQTSKF